MKKATGLVTIILIGLIISSCDKKNACLVNRRTATLKIIEEIKKEDKDKGKKKDDTRNTPANLTLNLDLKLTAFKSFIAALPGGSAKEALGFSHDALEHAAGVVNGTVCSDMNANKRAKDFIDKASSAARSADAAASLIANDGLFATIFAEHVIAEILDIPYAKRERFGAPFDRAANGENLIPHDLETDTYTAAYNELDKKVKELKKFFEKWKSRR